MSSSTPDLARLAELLAAGHATGKLVELPAGLVPATYADALGVQAAVAARLGGGIKGWKISIDPEGRAVPGPLLSNRFCTSGQTPAAGQPRQGLIEVEIAFRLRRDLPTRTAAYTRDEVLDAIDSVLVGIEVVAARLSQGPKAPFAAFLADNLGNGSYIAGQETREWRSLSLNTLRCTVEVDGRQVHDARGGHGQNDPLFPLLKYASAQIDALGGLRAGQVVTTGSLLPPIPFDRPVKVEATIEGIGSVTM